MPSLSQDLKDAMADAASAQRRVTPTPASRLFPEWRISQMLRGKTESGFHGFVSFAFSKS